MTSFLKDAIYKVPQDYLPYYHNIFNTLVTFLHHTYQNISYFIHEQKLLSILIYLSEVLTFENTAEFNNFFKYLILKQQQIFEDYPNDKQLHMDIHWKLIQYLNNSQKVYNLPVHEFRRFENLLGDILDQINDKYK